MTLFSPSLKRTELLRLSKSLEQAPTRLQIHIHRNHAFEPIASVIAPFLHAAGFMGEFVYGDYDDSLSFESLRLESQAQGTESSGAKSHLDSKDSKKVDLESKKLESATDLDSKKSKGEDCENLESAIDLESAPSVIDLETAASPCFAGTALQSIKQDSKISRGFQASKDSRAQKSAHILFIDTARYTLQGEKLEEFIFERALALREISPSPILVLLLKDTESKEVNSLDSHATDVVSKNQAESAKVLDTKKLESTDLDSQNHTEFAKALDSKKQALESCQTLESQAHSFCHSEGEESKNQTSRDTAAFSNPQYDNDLESKRRASREALSFCPQYDNDLDSKQTALSHKAAQKNIFIFDISALLNEYAYKAGLPTPIPLLDESKEIITGTRLSNAACLTLAQILGLKLLPALTLPSLKAIVCDLDNTLYAGILGEDGAENLTLTPAHKALQEQILAYKKQGFLLAIASKNDVRDVEALFQKRLDFPLRLSDFSCVQAHWEGKAQSLEAIAKGFNIGLDSLLFIDDNIAEIESTRHTNVRQLHALSPTHTLFALYLYPQMTRLVQNKEDSLRASDIAANAARASLEGLSDEEYFTNLGIELEFCINPKQSAQRIYELLNKTNQFIANYARPTLTEVQAWLEGEGHCVVSISMRDRLSESGIIGIVVGQRGNSSLGNHSQDCGDLEAVITHKVTPTPKSPQNLQSNTTNTRIVGGEILESKANSESSPIDSKANSKSSLKDSVGVLESTASESHSTSDSHSFAKSYSSVIASEHSEAWQSIKSDSKKWDLESATDSEKLDCHADKSARNDNKIESTPLQNLKSPTDSTTPTRHSKISKETSQGLFCDEKTRQNRSFFSKSGFLRGEQGNRTQGSLTKQDAQIHDFSRKAECKEQARIIELVVSYRALGRRLESIMLLQSFSLIAKELGAREDSIILAYQKGERNTPFLRTLATLITTQSAQNPQGTNKPNSKSAQELSEQAFHTLKERGELAIPLALPPTQGLSIHITKEQK